MHKAADRGDQAARGQLREAYFLAAAEQKRDATLQRVADFLLLGDGKIVIFTGRKRLVAWLAERIGPLVDKRAGLLLTMTGEDPDNVVEANRLAFRDHPGPCVLLGTWQKMGTSMDGLQTADVLHFNAIPTTPGMWEQAPGRGDRVNRKKRQFHDVLLCEGTIEEDMISAAIRKMEATSAVHAGSRLDDMPKVLGALDDPSIMEGLAAKILRRSA